MKLDFSAIAPDTNKELSGVWREWSNGTYDIEFHIKRAGGANNEFKIAFERATRKFRRNGVDLAEIAPEKQDEVMGELYADHIVLGWRSKQPINGVVLDDSNFDRDNLLTLYKQVPSTLAFCITQASSENNYLNAHLELEAGNSSKS